jgi:hypothetical protein
MKTAAIIVFAVLTPALAWAQTPDEGVAACLDRNTLRSVYKMMPTSASQFHAQATTLVGAGRIDGDLVIRGKKLPYANPCVAITHGVHCIPGMVAASCDEFFYSVFYYIENGKVRIVHQQDGDARTLANYRGIK